MILDAAPMHSATMPHGRLEWRESGAGGPLPALVLLHGIGSGAGSWHAQLEAFGSSRRVLAWDAPGYGASAPLATDTPLARDYAAALDQWLDAAGVRDLVLVGHSLGALVAAAWAARPSARLHALVLASPARGYGRAEPAVRAAKYRERVDAIGHLGPEGLAAMRAASLCAPAAPASALATVRASMARVTPRGYAQAAHLLAHDDLAAHLAGVDRSRMPVAVLCGALDAVTPPAACAALAREAGVAFRELAGLAHACYVEDPAAFNAALAAAIVRPSIDSLEVRP